MFSEKESGKPESWNCIVIIMVLTMIFNLGVIIVFRILLDSEDEINEPLIQGEMRDKMTAFLGIFTMTFFFGCWCCFCCGGLICKCIVYLPSLCDDCLTETTERIANMSRLRSNNVQEDEEVIVSNVVEAARGIPQIQLKMQPSDMRPYERSVNFDQIITTEAANMTHPSRQSRSRAYSIDVSFE